MALESVRMPALRGLNNKADPMALSPEWMSVADNGVINSAGKWRSPRPGWTQQGTGYRDIYASQDERNLYAITTAGEVVKLFFESSLVQIIIGAIGAGPYRWAEAGDIVYVSGAEDALCILPEGVRSWGLPVPRQPAIEPLPGSGSLLPGNYACVCTYHDGVMESGAGVSIKTNLSANGGLRISDIPLVSGYATRVYLKDPNSDYLRLLDILQSDDAPQITVNANIDNLGEPLKTQFYQPPYPGAEDIEFFAGRMWLAYYDPQKGFTGIFPSIDMGMHWFLYNSPDVKWIPGRVTVMAATGAGMLVGTNRSIELIEAAGDTFTQRYPSLKTNCGVRPGTKDWTLNGEAIVWTDRGLFAYPPGEFLTEQQLSALPGKAAYGGIIEYQGMRYCVVRPDDGGINHNPYAPSVAITQVT